jgi:outer membrane protein OmpA-like peptidoglycan-associated protein
VADYLIGKKVRGPERIVVRGYGAEQPLGDNATEEGRRKNRRVEITILEN